RKDNMYSFDMKNIVLKESLTCLVAKATDKYGYIRNHKKTVKNGQERTRESEEYKKKPKSQSRSQKSQASGEISQITLLTSSLSSSSRVEMEKAHILVGFCTKLLTKEAQAVTSRNDSLAILKCPHSIQRPIFVIQSLKEMEG
ncbi:hypothetical protein Tco_0703706, partial [Tanacetum coccineum]